MNEYLNEIFRMQMRGLKRRVDYLETNLKEQYNEPPQDKGIDLWHDGKKIATLYGDLYSQSGLTAKAHDFLSAIIDDANHIPIEPRIYLMHNDKIIATIHRKAISSSLASKIVSLLT